MFARNLLQAGDFVTLVPIGVPIILQYNDKGVVEKVLLGYEIDEAKDITDKVLTPMLQHKQVPNKVGIQGGTSYVRAVMHTFEMYSDPGNLPECVVDSMLKAYVEDPQKFHVFAGDIQSLSSAPRDAVSIRKWLTLAGFEMLPGYAITSNVSDEAFEESVKSNFPFRYPLVASYMIFNKSGVTFPNVGLTQFTVDDVKMSLDSTGNILAEIKERGTETVRLMPYATVVNRSIGKGTSVILDDQGKVVYVSSVDRSIKKSVSGSIACSCCGRNLIVPKSESAPFRCTDPQCNSVLYPRVKQLLQTLKLPEIDFDTYKKEANKIGNLFTVLDVLTIDPYKDLDIEGLPLTQAVRAIIPTNILPGQLQIIQLCDACNNSIESLTYYMQNVAAMKEDLHLDIHAFTRFFDWISNPENCSDVVEFLHLKRLTYTRPVAQFEGAPIFRDKTIMITGTFAHGDLEGIGNILRSYSATVTTKFSNSVDCVLVGGIPENVNGHAVSQARLLQIPVMDEFTFFNQYQIDEDLN